MIHVIAAIEVQPGKRDDFIDAFRKLVPLVLAEDGCIAYGPTVDVYAGHDAQIPLRQNVVTVVEQWESVAHLQEHGKAAHMVAFFQQVGEMVASVSLQVTEPV